MRQVDALAFIYIGNFISSCYTKQWMWHELLVQPTVVEGSIENQVAKFQLPSWFPTQESVLFVNDGWFRSRLRDVPIGRREQTIDAKNKKLFLDLSSKFLGMPLRVQLVYSPWFRFITEPVDFDIQHRVASYVATAFDYAFRREGHSTRVHFGHDAASVSLIESNRIFHARGETKLGDLTFEDGTQTLIQVDLNEKWLSVRDCFFPFLAEGLSTLSRGNPLRNCRVDSSFGTTTLRYQDSDV